MKTAQELLDEMKEIDNQIKVLKKQKEQIDFDINAQGYLIVKGKLAQNESVHAIEWDLDYNDYFVGEHGMHRVETSGAKAITAEKYELILGMIESKDSELGDYIGGWDVLNFSDGVLMNTLKDAVMSYEGDVICFNWKKKGEQDDTMNKGAVLKIHKSLDKLTIRNTRKIYENVTP